jgi:SAM-dependent methyltransferase
MGFLSHPLTRGIDVDDPQSTVLRRRIIRDKAFLRRLYSEWYALIVGHLPADRDDVLEIGSGAGFIKEVLPQAITSEVFALDGVDRVEDATSLSFADSSLDAIVMTDVLHHIPDVSQFFAEASRTLRDEGALILIEPWRTSWSQWVYRHFHHEPFRPDADDWRLPPGGPLSMANGAMPWMVFVRDRKRFERDSPELQVQTIQPLMPIAYLASGGVSLRALVPGVAYPSVRFLERRVLRERGAMFALIVIRRRPRLAS